MKVSDFRRLLSSGIASDAGSEEIGTFVRALEAHDDLDLALISAKIAKMKVTAPKPKAPRKSPARPTVPKETIEPEVAIQLLSDSYYNDPEFAAALKRLSKSTLTKDDFAGIYRSLFRSAAEFPAALTKAKRIQLIQQKRIEAIRFEKA